MLAVETLNVVSGSLSRKKKKKQKQTLKQKIKKNPKPGVTVIINPWL